MRQIILMHYSEFCSTAVVSQRYQIPDIEFYIAKTAYNNIFIGKFLHDGFVVAANFKRLFVSENRI